MKRLGLILLLLVVGSGSASAQAIQRLASQTKQGTIAANASSVALTVPPGVGFGSIGVEASGSWTGTIQIECAASASGGTFVALELAPRNSTTLVTSFTANGQWVGSIAGCQRVQATSTAWTIGTAQITLVGNFTASLPVLFRSDFPSPLFGPQSCTAPAYSFTSATTSGFGLASSTACIVIGGTQRFGVSASAATSTVPIVLPDGGISTPSLTFSTDTNLGLYLPAANNLVVTNAGVGIALFQSNVFQLGSGGIFGWSSNADAAGAGADTILARDAANTLAQRNATTAQASRVYNTYTSSISGEYAGIDWQTTANELTVGARTLATGTARPLKLVSQGVNGANSYASITVQSSDYAVPNIRGGLFSASYGLISSAQTGNWIAFSEGTSTATSGTISRFAILPTYNQASGTAANTDLLINRTQTAVGSGAQKLIDAQIATVSKFSVTTTGGTQVTTGQTTPPTCSSNCGTSVPTQVGTDTAMTITMGSGGSPASGFVVTFNGTWAAAPSCTGAMAKAGMAVGKLPMVIVTTTTTITVTTNGTAPATGDVYNFICLGVQ